MGHLPSEEVVNQVDTGYSPSEAGGGFHMMLVCTGENVRGNERNMHWCSCTQPNICPFLVTRRWKLS